MERFSAQVYEQLALIRQVNRLQRCVEKHSSDEHYKKYLSSVPTIIDTDSMQRHVISLSHFKCQS